MLIHLITKISFEKEKADANTDANKDSEEVHSLPNVETDSEDDLLKLRDRLIEEAKKSEEMKDRMTKEIDKRNEKVQSLKV